MTAVPGGGPHLAPTPLGGVRRTTTMVIAPQGTWAEGQTLTTVGRDLIRSPDDVIRTNHDQLTFDIDAAGLIAPPSTPDGGRAVPEALWGLPAQRGLRKNVAHLRDTAPDRGEQLLGPDGGLYDAMLDDVVGTTLASGYGRLFEAPAEHSGNLALHMSQTCIGFHTMHERREEFDVQRYFEKKQPSVDFVPADTVAWHQDDPMRPRSFRRRRMLQVAPLGDAVAVTGYFRDTFMTPEGTEKVVHEYGLDAIVSGPTLILDSVEASPGSLPLDHCPLASRSALRLEGLPLSEVETAVRRDLAGPAACTHLNDELRNLRLVPALLDLLDDQIRT